MSDDLTSALHDAERRLQAAQLAGDADVLDGLLDDRLIYTGGSDGARQPITAHVTATVRDRRFITVQNAGGAGPAPSSGSRSRAPPGRSRRLR